MKIKLRIGLSLLCGLVLVSCSKDAEPVQDQQTLESSDPTGLQKINALMQENPDNPDLHYIRGEYFYEMEGFDEAIVDFNRAIQLDSSQTRYWHGLSNVYLDYYREREAMQTMEMAAFLFPDSIYTQLKLAETYLILQKHQSALKIISNIKNLNPYNDEVHYLAGLVFADEGNLDMAISNLQTCVEINSQHIEGWYELGNLWNQKETGNDPIIYYNNALRIDSTFQAALFSKARTFYKQKKMVECIQTYNTMGRMYPSDESSFFNAGVVMKEIQAYDDALAKFNIAIELNPTLVQAYYYRGFCQLKIGNIPAGKADLEQALRFDPEYEDAKVLLSEIQ